MPMPPPRTTSATSVTAAIGTMWARSGAPPRRPPRAPARRPRGRRAKIARTSYGGASASCSRPRRARAARPDDRRPPGRSRARARRARSRPRRPRRCGRGAARRAARDRRRGRCRSRGTRSRPAVGHATPLLAERGEVDVVVEVTATPSGPPAPRRSAGPPAPGCWRRAERGPRRSTTPGTPATRRRRARPRGGRHDQGVAQAGHRREHGLRHRRSRARRRGGRERAAQVADRAAQEARADVDAEDERGVVDRLEEERAVARAAGIVLAWRTSPRRDERLQGQRDGRLGDPRAARDLGTRDRATGADRL